MELDEQTLREIREYEEEKLREETEFIESCNCKDLINKWDEEDWQELYENADYYND